MYSSNAALASSGYNSSFSLTPSSPSGSSYASSYSGIGASPNRHSEALFNSQVVRNGLVNIKEDGFASWLWRPKWLILKEQTLTIHKNEVSIRLIGTRDGQRYDNRGELSRYMTLALHSPFEEGVIRLYTAIILVKYHISIL